MPLTHLDLFAGIGGFSLACSWYGIQTTQFVEIDPYCQQVLAKNFPGVPIHHDITTYNPRLGEFDLISAGFPCQDVSVANPNGRGLEGERSGLVFEALRIIRTVSPSFCLFENVPNLLSRGMDELLWELAKIGFDAEWQTVSASSMGAPHRRNRVFIIAYSSGIPGLQAHPSVSSIGSPWRTRDDAVCGRHITANPKSTGTSRTGCPQTGTNQASLSGNSFWQQTSPPEPTICPLDDGVSRRLARQQLRALGNTVVPQCVAVALDRIMEINNQCN